MRRRALKARLLGDLLYEFWAALRRPPSVSCRVPTTARSFWLLTIAAGGGEFAARLVRPPALIFNGFGEGFSRRANQEPLQLRRLPRRRWRAQRSRINNMRATKLPLERFAKHDGIVPLMLLDPQIQRPHPQRGHRGSCPRHKGSPRGREAPAFDGRSASRKGALSNRAGSIRAASGKEHAAPFASDPFVAQVDGPPCTASRATAWVA